MKEMQFGGYIDYPGVGIIKDKDVYQCLVKHSRLIDRLDGRKMVEMTLLAQNVLMGLFNTKDQNIDVNGKWQFYGKKGLINQLIK